MLLSVFLLALICATPATASPARIHDSCRISTAAGTGIDEALAALRRCDNPAQRSASGTIWLDYPVARSAAGHGNLRFLFDNVRATSVDAYLIHADGSRQHSRYDPASPTREWAIGDYFSIRFDGSKQKVERIVVRLGGAEGASLARAPKLMATRTFARQDRDNAAYYGVAVGMLGVTILFHLSLFFAIRRSFQLFYCVHAALLLLYALCYSNLILLPFPHLSATTMSRLLSFSSTAATATGTLFVIDFLGVVTPVFLRRWARLGASVTLVSALLLLASPAAYTHATYLAANFAVLHSLPLIPAVLVVACWRRSRIAAFMLVAWLPPVIVALMFPLRNLGLIGDDMIPDGLMLLAVTVECLLLSLPVSQRIKALRIDHEQSRARHMLLERQALTDSLTGLSNRRGFTAAIERVYGGLAKPVRTALLVIDIDHFKRINDRYGHGCGDAILSSVASHVAHVAGRGAIVARYGGEEFVIALRDYDMARAGALAERLRATVGASTGDPLDTALPAVTISIGVACGQSDAIDSLIAQADAALYRAKNDGRNRVALSAGQARLTFADAA